MAVSPYVAVRLRPFLSEDVGWNCVIVGGENPATSVTLHNPSALAVDADPEEDAESAYSFSRVFNSLRRPEESTRKQTFCCNETMWDQVGEPCLRRCLEGQASTLLVCGQTGSGKSHSVVGHTEGMGNTIGHDTEEGVLPRLFEALFKLVDDNLDDKCVFEVEFGWVELRGELCYDLLAYAPKRPSDRPVPLGVFEHPSTGAHVRGQAWVVVNTLQEASEMLDTVMTMRALRATRWGDHGAAGVDAATLIATVRVTQTILPDTTKPGVKAGDPKQYVVGTVRLVELGGLEGLPSAHKHDVHASGDDALVGCSMAHHSLRNLARCFHVLYQIKGAGAGQTKEQASQLRRQAAELVPWRDAVLTLLLRDALLSTIGIQMGPRQPQQPKRRAAKHGGWVNSQSSECEEQLRMLLCISPASDDHDATLAALKFANRVFSLGAVKSSPTGDGGPEDELPGHFYVRQVGTFIDPKDKQALASGPAMHTSMLLRREVKRLEARLERAKDQEQQARDDQAEAAKSRRARAKTLVAKTKPTGVVAARREAARAADSKDAEQRQDARRTNQQPQSSGDDSQHTSTPGGGSKGKGKAKGKSKGKTPGKSSGKVKGKGNKRQKSRAAIPMNKKEQQEKQEADRRQRLHEAMEEQKAQEQKQVDDDVEVEERFEMRQFEERQLQLRLAKDAARQRAGMSSLESSDTASGDVSPDDIAALVSARKTLQERLEQIKGVQTAWLSRERPSGARAAESKKLWTKRRRALEWAGLMSEGDEKGKSQALVQGGSSGANGGNVPGADAQRAAATSTDLVSSRGKRAARDPHLELLHRDMSLSGRALFFCQLKGETVIGFADGEDYNDGLPKVGDDKPPDRVVASFDASGRMKVGKAEAQKRLHIILGGPELIGKHCIIRYNAPKRAWKTGSMTLQVLKRPGVTSGRAKNSPDNAGEDDRADESEDKKLRTRVFLNGRPLLCQEDGGSMTYALHHGDRLVLGYYNVLRVVHPHEADVLRQRAEGVLDEESSDLSDLSDDGEGGGEEKSEGKQPEEGGANAVQGPHTDRKPDEWNWLYAMEEVFATEIETMSHKRTDEEEEELQHRRWLHEQEAVAKHCNWDIDGVVDKDGDGNPKHRPPGAPLELPDAIPRDTWGSPEVASEDEDEYERKHDAEDDDIIDGYVHGSSGFALKWQLAGTPDDRVLGGASVHGHPSSVRKLHNQRNHVDAVLIAEELNALASEVGRLVTFRAYHEDFDEADVQGMTTSKAANAMALWQGVSTARAGNALDADAAEGAGQGAQPRNADSFVMCEIESLGPTATPRPPVVWCLDKAYNRLALCREMYTAFVCDCGGDLTTLDGEVDKYTLEQGAGFWPAAEDPFDDVADEQLLGKAEVFPRALSKLLPVHEQIPVINYAGHEQGTLTVGITPYVHPGEAASGPSRALPTSKPVTRRRVKAGGKQGEDDRADMLRRHSQELESRQAFARGWVMSNGSVDEQTDMIDAFRSGKRGHADIRFAVYIRHAAGLNPRLRHRLYVTYRMFHDYDESFSEQCPLPTTHPRWRYAGSHPCPRAGNDLLEYVSHGSIVFHVWGFPDTPPLQNPAYGHRATALHDKHVNMVRVSVTQLLVPRPPTLAESARLEARCEDRKRLLDNKRIEGKGLEEVDLRLEAKYDKFKKKVDAEEAKTKKRWENKIGKKKEHLEKGRGEVKELEAQLKEHSRFCVIQ